MSTASEGGLAGLDRLLRNTFEWYTVSKKEFKDAIRSKGLWLLGLIFTTAFIAPVALALYFDIGVSQQGQGLGMQLLLSQVYLNMVTLLLPIVAIFLGFAAISKERTSGSLKLLLSLPHSRKDVIIGKVLGRCAVLGVPLVASLAITAVFLTASRLTFKPELFGLFSFFTVVFALVFVAIVVSISGAFEKSLWSGAANFIVYFYFTFLWNAGANGVGNILSNELGVTGAIRWHVVLLLKLVNPNQAYKTLVNSMLGSGEAPALSARYGMFSQGQEASRTICADVLNGAPQAQEGVFGTIVTCAPGSGSLPFYYSDPAVVVFMLTWIGIAASISYYTFNLADL
ncbi:ABC transporter permease [Halomicroarcula sp. F13]|uniref:ABC transporter permease n=1 Tax=Haloarcula rubra TaxID=2487747 RepID=A0AAW4PVD2_9EURY|nr:ABC transporter permease subunit [Halomicroarcula rubra]MBX0324222.1 ABC transporter permease [Halomicroarcula rubra]